MDDNEVIAFLLQTEIIPLCLRIMDNGSELSKTVATFIIQKILLDDMGLNYICATYERFSTVASVLSKMVNGLIERPSIRLLKHIVRCYLRLSDNPRARDALRTCLPMHIRDNTFNESLKDDPTTKRWLTQLLYNVNVNASGQQQQGDGSSNAQIVGSGGNVGMQQHQQQVR
jgi:CCR4-NOT transcription complex subunit 9